VRGVRRSALLAVPAAYDGHHRLPVIIGFHGYDQTAATFDGYTRLQTSGTAMGAVVAVPQGVGSPPGWNVPDSSEVGPSDVAFIDALLRQLAEHACADPARVVLAGLSDGSDMAVTAACALAGRVRVLLLVAASTGPSPRCPAVAVLQVHGTADPVDAYAGRAADIRRGFGSVKAAGAEQAVREWAQLARCAAQPAVSTSADLRIVDYHACAVAPVRLVAVQGGGHTWPGARPSPAYGRTTTSIGTRGLLREVLAADRPR
jgi:polyhydroxybutyrate depolymerase